MAEKFTVQRNLAGAELVHENHSPRWHSKHVDGQNHRPSWPDIRRLDEAEDPQPTNIIKEPIEVEPNYDLNFSECELAHLCALCAEQARNEAILQLEQQAGQAKAEFAQLLGEAVAQSEAARRELIDNARAQLTALLQTTVNALNQDLSNDARLNGIVGFVNRCIAKLDHPDTVTLAVAPDLEVMVRATLEDRCEKLNLQTRIEVVPQASLGGGQARVSWKDGWAENDPEAVSRIINEQLALLSEGPGEPDDPGRALNVDRPKDVEMLNAEEIKE